MFSEGTTAWYANEIGKIQGRIQLCDDWARLNGGFQIIAAPMRGKLEDKITSLQNSMNKLRERRK